MEHKNILRGVKQIYTSEKLSLISGFCLLFGSITVLISNINENIPIGVAGLILILASGVLNVVAFCYNYRGIKTARSEQPLFSKALLWLFAGIACSVLSVVLKNINATISSFLTTVSEFTDVLVTYFILSALIALAQEQQNTSLKSKGTAAMRLIIIVQMLSFLLSLLAALFETFGWGETANGLLAMGIINIVSELMRIVAFILYLNTLSGTIKMLEQEQPTENISETTES
ncbi:MAG: hypothetical protein IKE65_01520 [Clostridia bacterium]|nr:hypothetical protein [Clostridia bacterium]